MRTASQAPSRSTALLGVATAAVASAAYVHYRSRQAERDHPPAGKFVSVEGVLLHYVEKGRGEPLVLLHGNTSMSSDFVMSGLVERAAEKYRVIVFDRPGYGWSQRPRGRSWRPAMQAALLQRALQQIDAPRSIVLGHSWGTLVAMAMALDFPRSVRALVLEAGYYYPTPRPDILLGTLPAVPVIGDLLRYTFSPLLLRASWPALARHLFAPAKVPDHFWRFPPWMAFRPSQLRASAVEVALLAPSAARLRHRYRGLTVPTVIVAGHEDRVVSCSSHSGRLARELPHADFRVFPGMGHMLHHLIPGEVLDAIDAAAARQFPAAVCAQSRVE